MPASSNPSSTGLLSSVASSLSSLGGSVEKATLTIYLPAQSEVKQLYKPKKSTGSSSQPKEVKHTIEVNFNPNSIRIEAMGGGYAPQRNLQDDKSDSENNKAAGQEDTYEQPPRIEVSFSLIFDAMSIEDAFLLEKLNNITSVSTVTSLITSALSSSTTSVEPVVEGIIAALLTSKKSEITFTWGNMYFTGRMNSIDSTYTMFNPNGAPVRAEVGIHMVCIEEVSNKDSSSSNLLAQNKAAWFQMYKYMLEDAES